jgi:hypothetical protein
LSAFVRSHRDTFPHPKPSPDEQSVPISLPNRYSDKVTLTSTFHATDTDTDPALCRSHAAPVPRTEPATYECTLPTAIAISDSTPLDVPDARSITDADFVADASTFSSTDASTNIQTISAPDPQTVSLADSAPNFKTVPSPFTKTQL